MRKRFIIWLFKKSQKIYVRFKKNKPWDISREQLLQYAENTFGYQLGLFLQERNIQLIPKVENHDAYHVLTGYKTRVQDEVALQYVCFGNGKRSLYLLGAIILGTLLLPEYSHYFMKSYKLGKKSNTFLHFKYENLLHFQYQDIKEIIFNSSQILQIQ